MVDNNEEKLDNKANETENNDDFISPDLLEEAEVYLAEEESAESREFIRDEEIKADGKLLHYTKVVLSGMNEEEQVNDNLQTFSPFIPLNDQEQRIVSSVRTKLKSITKVGCTSCKYCMPCPKGVEIPSIFAIYNDYGMYKNETYSKNNYQRFENANKGISSCVGCMLCASKCPQGINPPEVFKKMKEEMKFIK